MGLALVLIDRLIVLREFLQTQLSPHRILLIEMEMPSDYEYE